MSPKSLKNHFITSDIVICASGTTVYEVLRLRKELIIYSLAENQKLIEEKLREYGVIGLGYYQSINWDKLPAKLNRIISQSKDYQKKLLPLFEKFDGKGALRIARISKKMFKN